jgi:hypothetical protein
MAEEKDVCVWKKKVDMKLRITDRKGEERKERVIMRQKKEQSRNIC